MKLGNLFKSKYFLAVVFFLGLYLVSIRDYGAHIEIFFGCVLMSFSGYFFLSRFR